MKIFRVKFCILTLQKLLTAPLVAFGAWTAEGEGNVAFEGIHLHMVIYLCFETEMLKQSKMTFAVLPLTLFLAGLFDLGNSEFNNSNYLRQCEHLAVTMKCLTFTELPQNGPFKYRYQGKPWELI